jgi:hypothetical protein
MLHPLDHQDRNSKVLKISESGVTKTLYLGECRSVSWANGWIVGTRYIGSPSDPNFPTRNTDIVYHDGKCMLPDITPVSVNSDGTVVGFVNKGHNSSSFAAMEVKGHVYNLQQITSGLPHGYVMSFAASINDKCWIIADATYPGVDPAFPATVVLKPE